MITKFQKQEIKRFMAQTPYYACYTNLHKHLSQKYTKPKVAILMTWAINNKLDTLCIDYD